MLKSEKYTHPLLSQVTSAHFNEEESGLNLGQIGATIRRRALLIAGVTGIVATGAVFKAKTEPPVYQGKFEILTKPVTGESKAVASIPQTIGSQAAGGIIMPPDSEITVKTTLEVLRSPRILDPVITKLQNKYPELDYGSLTGDLIIKSEKPNILAIEYTDSDQQKVRDVLNLIKNAYLSYSLAERQEEINQAIAFVNKQVRPVRRNVERWQEKLRVLRSRNNFVDPTLQAQQVSSQINSLTQQQLENRVQLQQMQSRYEDLQRELSLQPGTLASNSVLSDNPRYQRILDQIQTLNAEVAKRGAVFTDQEEGMQRLYEQQASLVSMLEQERARVNRDFQSRIRELQVKDISLGEKIVNLNAYIRNLATISRDHENIQRELKIATESLTQFTAKQQALQIEKAQRQQPWRPLDPKFASVNQPTGVSDSAKLYLALGSMLGLLLGTGAALVVDKLSNVFYTSEELKETTRLPLLGTVPLRKELGAMAWQEAASEVQQAARASFFEVFRSLYTNILLLGSDTPIRSLVISSAAQEDGKTTVAIHLALSAAAMGHRVLLVDANLRFPTIHNRVGLMNIQGLTDVISQDLDWNNVIERSPLEDNLYVLTAGPVPPDSIRLLASRKMQDLMNELQATYDLVIYDTPPLLGFADANLLAANTNGLVLVAGLGKLKRTLFQQALESLQVSGTPILGVIANKSKDASTTSYSYYQQYYKQSASSERVGADRDSEIVKSQSTSSSRDNGRS